MEAGAEGYILKNASADKILQSIIEVSNDAAFITPSVALRVKKHFNNKSETDNNVMNLTVKEKEVLKNLTDGMSYKMVADKMSISYYTVNSHIKKIYEKLQVHSVGEAISFAMKNKLCNDPITFYRSICFWCLIDCICVSFCFVYPAKRQVPFILQPLPFFSLTVPQF